MAKIIETYIIPSWAMCYFVNADSSGMSDEDIKKCEAFEQRLIKEYGTAYLSCGDLETIGFRHRNDIDSLGCDCYEMHLVM